MDESAAVVTAASPPDESPPRGARPVSVPANGSRKASAIGVLSLRQIISEDTRRRFSSHPAISPRLLRTTTERFAHGIWGPVDCRPSDVAEATGGRCPPAARFSRTSYSGFVIFQCEEVRTRPDSCRAGKAAAHGSIGRSLREQGRSLLRPHSEEAFCFSQSGRTGKDSRGSPVGKNPSASPFSLFFTVSRCRVAVNDPSAGSPTETLLRLLLPLNDQV